MAPKKRLTQREVHNVVRRYKHHLHKENIPFTMLYLFGSYAKKNTHDWSDVDVAVVGKQFGKNYIKESVRLNTIADRVHPLLEAHPCTPAILDDPYSTFADEIRTHGKKI